MTPTVVLSARGELRLRSGHPWIYRADVADVQAAGGDRVVVRAPRGRILGYALYSDRSQIAVRMLSYGERPADDELLKGADRRRARRSGARSASMRPRIG